MILIATIVIAIMDVVVVLITSILIALTARVLLPSQWSVSHQIEPCLAADVTAIPDTRVSQATQSGASSAGRTPTITISREDERGRANR